MVFGLIKSISRRRVASSVSLTLNLYPLLSPSSLVLPLTPPTLKFRNFILFRLINFRFYVGKNYNFLKTINGVAYCYIIKKSFSLIFLSSNCLTRVRLKTKGTELRDLRIGIFLFYRTRSTSFSFILCPQPAFFFLNI